MTGNAKPDGPLTAAERQQQIEQLLAAYPRLSRLLQRAAPSLVRVARAKGLDDDEIEAEALYATVLAARLYDPAERKRFRNYALQRMRKEIAAAAERRVRERQFEGIDERIAARETHASLAAALPPRLREYADLLLDGEPFVAIQQRLGWGCERRLRAELTTYLRRD